MPLRWEILHAEKLVYLVADGTVTLKDLEQHFDAVMVADAMPYAHLFNALNCQPVYNDDDVMAMAARVSAYASIVKSGPLAVVAQSDEVEDTFRRFINLSSPKRPTKLFKTEAKARAWLATQPLPASAAPTPSKSAAGKPKPSGH
ncbi:MAG: hypothetical protein K2Y40_05715 [Reyranella sp.]|nr:hypothetical protein [Reyranella sp.]